MEKNKSGTNIANERNLELIFNNDEVVKECAGFDLFSNRKAILRRLPWIPNNEFVPQAAWRDAEDDGIQNYIGRVYDVHNEQMYRRVINEYAQMRSFHPIRDFFRSLPPWDKWNRAEQFFCDGLEIENTEYARAVTRCWLIAAVARVFHPGCKWDYVLVIKGDQGAGKSTLFSRLAMGWFNDSIGSLDGKDVLEQLQGSWIIELAELQATKKSENEQIKAFISRQIDKFRRSYGRNVEEYPRQCVFCGSTNSEEFLKDQTGGRRFLVLVSHATKTTIEKRLKGLTDEYVKKVWAEVFHWYNELFKNDTAFDERLLDIPKHAKETAEELQKRYTEGSELEATIKAFLDKKIPRREIWKVLSKKERRAFVQGELSQIKGNRISDWHEWIDLEGEEYRQKVCAAEIAYETMCIDNPGDPKNRSTMRQINEILSRLSNWQRADVKFGVRFDEYGQQKISFENTSTDYQVTTSINSAVEPSIPY